MKNILGLALCLAMASPAFAQEQPRRVVVTGEGVVASVPDMAIVRLGVSAQKESASDAMEATSNAMTAILERLSERGVASADMQTSGLNIYPVMSNSSSSGAADGPAGYNASSMLSIRLRDINALGGVLDALIQDGVNRVDGIEFTIQDMGPILEEARKRAVADARAKAELYATAAGVTLGEVLEISESGGAAPGPMMMRAAMVLDAVPVAIGETETRAQVTVVYGIE